MSQKLRMVRFTGRSVSGNALRADATGAAPAAESKSRAAASVRRAAVRTGPRTIAFGTLALVWAVCGCARTSEPEYVSSADVRKLPDPLQSQVREILTDRCGTVRQPKLLKGGAAPEQLARGREVFAKRCEQCHGVTGDGTGPAAATLIPKPRDYRKGIFKFTSTPYGARPRREDLLGTLKRGVPGTSMPSFELLPKPDLEALVDYVQVLSMRGEYESALAREAPDAWSDIVAEGKRSKPPQKETELATAFRKAFKETERELLDDVAKRWQKAREQEVMPLTAEPVLTAERIFRGRAFFLDKATGCNKCHGADGRGQTPENLRGDLKDAWGHPTQAADLTSGLLRGGSEPVDLYRRIYSGINGTPMPGFSTVFAKKPDRVWDVVAFVVYLSNERRRGVIPEAATGSMPGLGQPKAAAVAGTRTAEVHPRRMPLLSGASGDAPQPGAPAPSMVRAEASRSEREGGRR